jgi:hypothetical protein
VVVPERFRCERQRATVLARRHQHHFAVAPQQYRRKPQGEAVGGHGRKHEALIGPEREGRFAQRVGALRHCKAQHRAVCTHGRTKPPPNAREGES